MRERKGWMRPGVSALARVLLLLVALTLVGGCSYPRLKPCVKGGKTYGVIPGWYSGEWWEMYEAALSYADGECWDKAREYFEKCIRIEPEDKWRIRTGGTHYTDWGYNFVGYFPHRELGIVYYRLREQSPEFIDLAARELVRSLASEESKRGTDYLAKAVEYKVRRENADRSAPFVKNVDAAGAFPTSEASLTILGRAGDDVHAGRILAKSDRGHERVFSFDLIDKEKKALSYKTNADFALRFPLEPGYNLIDIMAVDFTGKRSEPKRLTAYRDVQSPAITFWVEPRSDSKNIVALEFQLADEFGLGDFFVNGNPYPDALEKKGYGFPVEVSTDSKGTVVTVAVRDMAGNESVQRIDDKMLKEVLEKAMAPPPAYDRGKPSIKLSDDDGTETSDGAVTVVTFDRQKFIYGRVCDDTVVASLSIDGVAREFPRKRCVGFAGIVQVESPDSSKTVELVATDAEGNKDVNTITVERKTRAVSGVGARLCVGLEKMEKVSPGIVKDDADMSKDAEARFFEAMTSQGRFQPAAGEHSGGKSAPEAAVFCDVEERRNLLETRAVLVDLDTETTLASENYYVDVPAGQEARSGAILMLMEGLNLEFAESLPLLEGKVLEFDKDTVTADLGLDAGIKAGMKIYVFKKDPADAEAGCDILGEARVKHAKRDRCMAEPERLDRLSMEEGHLVITK